MSDFPPVMKSVRVLAISGSLRRASTNTAALEALARLAPEGVKVLVYGDLATLPPFNPDDDMEDKPKPEPIDRVELVRFKHKLERTMADLLDEYSKLLSPKPPA